jgi:hypothetical protein
MEADKSRSLIQLLDDPDNLVFEAVSEKILQVGIAMVPDLEMAAKQAMSSVLFERIEHIIKILHFNQLKEDFRQWILNPNPRLIDGAWLMARYQFPDLSKQDFYKSIKPLRDEIWLELSDTLTALEKITVMNTLVFGRKRVLLNSDHPNSPGNNFIHRMIETGKANAHSINLLYAILAQESGIPLFVVDTPDYPLLAYVDMPFGVDENLDPELFDVLFYVNPVDKGLLHSRSNITEFLIRQKLPLDPIYYNPRANTEFIRICLNRLSLDYDYSGSKIRSMHIEDLGTLWKL